MALMLNQLQIYGQKFRAGGIIGYGVQTYLNYYFEVVGSYLLVLLVLILSLMMTLDLSLVSFSRNVMQFVIFSVREKPNAWPQPGEKKTDKKPELSEKPAFADGPLIADPPLPRHGEEVPAGAGT